MTVMGILLIWSNACQVVSSQVLEVIQIESSLATGQSFKTVYYFKIKIIQIHCKRVENKIMQNPPRCIALLLSLHTIHLCIYFSSEIIKHIKFYILGIFLLHCKCFILKALSMGRNWSFTSKMYFLESLLVLGTLETSYPRDKHICILLEQFSEGSYGTASNVNNIIIYHLV